MKLVLAAEMRALDNYAEDELGLPGLLLMENAGRAVADAATELLGDVYGQQVLVLCGKGNNGGDGFGAARWLQNRGANVRVVLTGAQADLRGSAADELQFFLAGGGRLTELGAEPEMERSVQAWCQGVDLIIDALLGTGFSGELRPNLRQLCRLVNSSPARVLAVDVPTGVDSDTGAADDDAVQADATVTMALPKLGLYLYPGRALAGHLTVADIGMPERMLREAAVSRWLLTDEYVRELLPERPADMHKGDAGRVCVAAGSYGYLGAAALCAGAAVRGGAGLVTLFTAESAREPLAIKLTEVMVKGLPEAHAGCLAPEAQELLTQAANASDVLALGPGLGTHPATAEVIRQLLPEVNVPMVLDADALTALAGHTELLPKLTAPVVVTPHPGEMARLLDRPVHEVNARRVDVARQAALDWQVVVVLKGAPTVVALPDGRVYVNPTGNANLATGGSGDVLTGCIAALVAQGAEPEQAALAGVFLHGRAGEKAGEGKVGLAAGEIAVNFPVARYELEHGMLPKAGYKC